VCSDELHCGLVLDEDRAHVPFALVDPVLAERCITLMAASKTYNIPGLACAFAVIPNADLRRRFCATMRGIVPDANILGFVATEAAYRDCEDWHRELLAVLRANRDRVAQTVAAIPRLSMTHVEATYLAWIDVRRLGVENPQRFFEAAGVGLSEGADFGLPGWLRLNFGCPRATLERALARIISACSALSP
jgi:cystathionine beta-lyase